MIEIGKTKIVAVRKKGGKKVLGPDGQPVTAMRESVVKRITRTEYGHNSKYRRRLIVSLHGNDMLTLRPTGFRTEKLIVTINLGDVYQEFLVRRLQREALAKAREKKAKKADAAQRRAASAKERRFTEKLRAESQTSGWVDTIRTR